MADVYAVKNGNWSDTTLWNTNSLPATIDNVYSNNFTVYVNISPQVNFVTNLSGTGITAGGRFILNNTVSLTANVIGGGADKVACVQFLSASPAFCTIYGSLCAVNTTISGPRALLNNSSGTITVYGNGLGRIKGSGNPADGYIQNQSTGTLNLFGNYIAGINAQVDNRGIWNQAAGTINLVGNLSGGNGVGNQGLYNASTGSVNVTGNIFGVTDVGLTNIGAGQIYVLGDIYNGGLINNSTGNVNVLGNIFGGIRNVAGIQNASTGTINITGNVFGGTGGSGAVGAENTSNGILTVTGNVAAGISHGVRNNGNNTLTITGNVTGSLITSNVAGAQNLTTGTLRINGNVFALAGWGANNASTGTLILSGNATGGNNAPGVINSSTGTSIVYGNVFGTLNPLFVFPHYGVQNNSTGTLIVSGNAVAGLGNTAYGAFNNTTGILRVKRAVGNNWGLGYTQARASTPGVFSNAQGSQTFVEELECGPRGQWPTGGVIFFTPNPKATSQFETDTFQNYTLIQSNSADNLQPPVSSVRQGTTYNLGLSTGTCIIPPVSSVAVGTLVDNLTGIAVLTPQGTWNYPTTASDINSMGGRLRNALNTNSANSLINSFNP